MNNSKFLLLLILSPTIFLSVFLIAMEPMELESVKKEGLENLPANITHDVILFKLVNTGRSLRGAIRNIKAYLLTHNQFLNRLNERNIGDINSGFS